MASKHDGRAKFSAADYDARNALMERLFRERGGRDALDIVSQLILEDYATAVIQLGKVTRRLEALGAVSTAGNQRSSLVATYDKFSARVTRLKAELPPVTVGRAAVSSPSERSGIMRISYAASQLLTELEALEAADELTAIQAAQLDAIRLTVCDAKIVLALPPNGRSRTAEPAAPPLIVNELPTTPPELPAAVAPARRALPSATPNEARCTVCNRSLELCQRFEMLHTAAWRSMHRFLPREIERRKREEENIFNLRPGHHPFNRF